MTPNSMTATVAREIPQTEVGASLQNLAGELKTTSERVGHLEERLGTVLAQRKPEGGQTETSAPEPVRVPLAQMIHEHMLAAARINEQLASIINRLEV